MMETRNSLWVKLLFCLADLLLLIIGATTAQPCTASTCPLCQQCTADDQNGKYYHSVDVLRELSHECCAGLLGSQRAATQHT